MTPVLSAWLAEVVLIFWRDWSHDSGAVAPFNHFPAPSELAATFVIYGVLGFMADAGPNASRAAGLIGWGLVAATFLRAFDPTLKRQQQKPQQQPQPPFLPAPATPGVPTNISPPFVGVAL